MPARAGKFELAHRGTLFLDEIGTLSPAVQGKLLRALESREVERLGGSRPFRVDIRLISATNESLDEAIGRGSFREDLFYRINAVTLRMPPLRDRLDDIPVLAEHFAEQFAHRHRAEQKRFSLEALQAMQRHPWRGNVRELEHLVEMLTLFVDEQEVRPEHFPAAFHQTGNDAPPGVAFTDAVAQFEKKLLIRAVERAGGVKAQAARELGLDANQMKYLCRKYQV